MGALGRKPFFMTHLYIAGPMRGYPRYNFDAFLAADIDLRDRGFEPINPAKLDLDAGFDPDKDPVTPEFMEDAMRRDIAGVMKAEGLVLLPGWERSMGAKAEKALAEWRGIPVLLYPSLVELNKESILLEAERLTDGDRQNQYGPPEQDFARTAAMWNSLFGWNATARDVAMAMICLKLSRQTHMSKRDNWTDIAGYAKCGWRCP